MKKNVLFAVIITILVVVVVGQGLILAGILPLSSAEEQTAGNPEQTKKSPPPAFYVRLDPAFTVSFADGEDAQFLQLKLNVTTQDADVGEAVKQHMPAIRNALVLLFSSQKAADLRSRAGKEELRQAALEEIQRVLEASTGKPGVTDVLFTGFLMQ